ncbi:50S ribosomal protein L4 [Sporohalobacter salinus]|uniref:50S ribosomal protein L4 n=1 Tax=Sporohalobacter salinus TaxID=1494606 RepID=UPI001960C700|nr:50S ribosomal protein L4 [Sporohalobacter salinus]MBM7623983.1 large subunit ribosomal protein L4 [Sporohalobacter salinus]
MPELTLFDTEGNQVGEVGLNQDIFDIEINEHVVHEAVTAQLAAKRAGTASTKTRGEVRGGGRKPWRQKGTGRARHGSIRSPIWVGGGTTFGPQPRDYSKDIPKKVKKLAVKSALTAKVRDGELTVVDGFDFDKPKTKQMVKVLEVLDAKDKKVLVITDEKDDDLYKSARNIPDVKVLLGSAVNVYDVLDNEQIIITEEAIKKVEEVLDK